MVCEELKETLVTPEDYSTHSFRLEKSSKISTRERLKLKDMMEDLNGEPKAGDVAENMKKHLRKIKVIGTTE